jgi:hypothetical protein
MEPTNSQVLSDKLQAEAVVTLAEIERVSRSLAEQKGNPDYYISADAWGEIERGATPSIYKLFSLAICLQVPYERVMRAFGVDPLDANVRVELERTELVRINLRELGFSFELNLDRHFDLRHTHLLDAESAAWQHLPAPLQERLNPSRYQYGLIGSEDDGMGDLIPAGSLVEIDRRQTSVDGFAWKTLHERPVFVVRHAHGYSCAWCQQDGPELTLLPHPLSRMQVLRFPLPQGAEIIGRVVSVWLF